jgi:indole-3-acetaldehyde oxidase
VNRGVAGVKSVPDFAQVEGAFVQGVGFFTNEEYRTNSNGMLINDGTYTYKIPTVDTIPKQFNVEFFDSPHSQKRVLSSKGEASDHMVLFYSITTLQLLARQQ